MLALVLSLKNSVLVVESVTTGKVPSRLVLVLEGIGLIGELTSLSGSRYHRSYWNYVSILCNHCIFFALKI